jgi:hypothetical protein
MGICRKGLQQWLKNSEINQELKISNHENTNPHLQHSLLFVYYL